VNRLQVTDRLFVFVLVPLWLVCFTLHLREVARTGIAMPVPFAAPQGADAYPLVGGFHLERGTEGVRLEVGDRLIRVGETDLRSVGEIGFRALAVENAGPGLRVPLVVERDGVRRQVALELRPYPLPWFRLPHVLGLAALAIMVWSRARPTPSNRLAFIGAMVLAIGQSPFPGGSYWQTVIAWPFFYLGNPLGIALIIRWAIGFPEQVPDRQRLSPRWAWAVGLASLLPRASYALGGPIPSQLIPVLEHAADGLFFVCLLGALAWNHAHANAAGRRALRWVLYGFSLPGIPLAILLILPTVLPEFGGFSVLLGWAGVAGIVGIGGMLFSIVRYQLFDIDRLISVTATYTTMAVLLIGGTVALVPGLAELLDSYTGIGSRTAQLALALAVAALGVPVYNRVRPRMDRFFLPEREALESGTRRLLEDLHECARVSEVWELVDSRIEALLRAERCVTFVRRENHFVVSPHEGIAEMQLDPEGALLSHLEAHPSPVALGARGLPAPPPAHAALFEELDTRLLIPLRKGKDLAALICLGPKRSADVYTATDMALLGAIAEGASAQLRLIRDTEEIRQQRERSEEMRRLKEEAEQANLAKSRFLAAASHDLRQPLHALGLFVDALDEQIHEERARPLVDRVRRSTASLTEMFDALLDISRLDAGAVAPEIREFELAPLLDRLEAELGVQAEAKGVSLRCVPSSLVVRSDPLLFARIVGNLLTNAIRYTEMGRVLVGVRRCGADLRVEVWDTGPGIPEERAREIFQEFVQLEGDQGKGGLGLGLSIVDRLARLLGHEVTLRSEPGRGSVFAVTAQRGERRIELAGPVAPSRAGCKLEGRCILVLDDEPDILEGMQRTLERWGCRVLLASSEREARLHLEELGRAPDALLADYRLRGEETGLEVVAAIRACCGTPVPAAIVTGDATILPLEAIRAAGLPVLRKPAKPARLRAVLTQLLMDSEAPTATPS
jgi:signal transduction histidine kinase/CheY-like chemotaxis protein